MRDNGNLLGKSSDGYERLYPSMLASWSNVSTSSNSAMVVSLLMLAYFTLSVSGTAKRGLLSMISDSSLGGRIMKSKIDPSFGQIAFFIRTCSSVFHCIWVIQTFARKIIVCLLYCLQYLYPVILLGVFYE